MRKCKTCKNYSDLIVVPNDFGECWYCQAHECIFCTGYGKRCGKYEKGEDNGGKLEE